LVSLLILLLLFKFDKMFVHRGQTENKSTMANNP
jgi:hypothetical protein